MTLEDRLTAIENRNARVELDKAWETSLVRRLSICIITYGTALGLLWIQQTPHLFLGACIPVCGYILSTLSLPWIRRRWQQRR